MKKPTAEIVVSATVLLQVLGGRLVVKHKKLTEPVPIDARHLERWLLRQLREQVV